MPKSTNEINHQMLTEINRYLKADGKLSYTSESNISNVYEALSGSNSHVESVKHRNTASSCRRRLRGLRKAIK